MPELTFLRDLIVLFGLGVLVVLAFHRLRVPPIVGFLITGVLAGPYGFGLISGVHEVEALAEIGVVLLLFTIGIELSLDQLRRLRTFLLVGGGLQVGITIAAAATIALAFGLVWRQAIFLGMLLALSSTAIVLRLLAERGELDSPHGRSALGILIFQDLAIVPMILATPFLGGIGGNAVSVLIVVAKALGFALAALLVARFAVPWLLDQVVAIRRREVFLLTIIVLCLGMAWASSQVGLSLALGAFIAGLILAESEYNHQALGEILPLREVFNSLFFVAIGMLFDVRTVIEAPAVVFGALAVSLVIKAVVNTSVAWTLGQSLRVAVLSGLAIAQIGEFSFVLSRVGVEAGLLDPALYQIFLAVAVGSMAFTPLLFGIAPRVSAALERSLPARLTSGRRLPGTSNDGSPHETRSDHVIIVGYGMNGRNLARVLRTQGISFIAIDMNADTVRNERDKGVPILYGDATRPEVLEYAGIDRARVLVIAISDLAATRGTVDTARRLNNDIHIIARSRYVQEMEGLYLLGTNEVVPEELETSIEVLTRVLQRYLVPRETIARSIIELRRDFSEMFRTMSEAYSPARGLDRYLTNLSLAVYRVDEGSPLAGRTLEDSNVRARSGATVVAIQRPGGESIVNPAGTDVIDAGDRVILLGHPEQLTIAGTLFHARVPAAPPPDTAPADAPAASSRG